MSWVKTVVESTTNAWHTAKVTFLKSLQCFILQRKTEVHLSSLFHKGVPSFPAITFGVYTKWFSVTYDAHSFGFVFKVSAKVLDRNVFRTNNTVSSALLHRNYIILLVQTPGIYISSRPGWRSAKSTTKTLSCHQMAHDINSKCEENLRGLPHFLQNGERI